MLMIVRSLAIVAGRAPPSDPLLFAWRVDGHLRYAVDRSPSDGRRNGGTTVDRRLGRSGLGHPASAPGERASAERRRHAARWSAWNARLDDSLSLVGGV